MSVIVDEVVARVDDPAPATESEDAPPKAPAPASPRRLCEALRSLERRASRRRAH